MPCARIMAHDPVFYIHFLYIFLSSYNIAKYFEYTGVMYKSLIKYKSKDCCWTEISRSSHQRYSLKKGVPRNFGKFKGKHLCQSHFFNKVASLRPATLLKKRPWHRCFPVNFAKFLRKPFLQNTSRRLLLNLSSFSFNIRFLAITLT